MLYALHLRFMCTLPKKRLRSVLTHKSDPLSSEARNLMDNEHERSFYLYDDMRVVFPQRHSDSDEGKVCTCIHESGFTISIDKLSFALLETHFFFMSINDYFMLQLHVEYHFPSNPKYFDISS
jgi:hypothetical protein